MSVEDLTIRSYEPGDEARILTLFNDVFAEDDPDYHQRASAAWHWEYLAHFVLIQVALDLCQSPINHHGLAKFAHDDIGRLNVTVENASTMGVGNRLTEVQEVGEESQSILKSNGFLDCLA